VFVRDEIALLILDYLKDNPMTLSDYLFESRIRKGYPIDKTNWNKAFAKASLQATGKKFHPHQLRGTRATTWYDQGIDIARIQQRLGHSNISTTMLYIKPDARKELELWSQEQ
jgi:integrase